MPDELVSQSRDAKSELQTIQAEAQWKDLVSEVKALWRQKTKTPGP